MTTLLAPVLGSYASSCQMSRSSCTRRYSEIDRNSLQVRRVAVKAAYSLKIQKELGRVLVFCHVLVSSDRKWGHYPKVIPSIRCFVFNAFFFDTLKGSHPRSDLVALIVGVSFSQNSFGCTFPSMQCNLHATYHTAKIILTRYLLIVIVAVNYSFT
jgi:hypothetical protein